MNRLLFTIIFFALTTTSCASSSVRTVETPNGTEFVVESLDNQYATQRAAITAQCAAEAKSLMYATRNRDAGVPLKAVVNQVLNMAVDELKNRTLHRALTIEDVLYQITMITIIYHSPMTQEEIFNAQFRFCEKESLDILNAMYKRALEIQNGK